MLNAVLRLWLHHTGLFSTGCITDRVRHGQAREQRPLIKKKKKKRIKIKAAVTQALAHSLGTEPSLQAESSPLGDGDVESRPLGAS